MLAPSASEQVYKVIMLGNSGVGKTSLVSRWVRDEFSDGTRPTIGASNFIKDIEIDSKNVKVTLWDTAGQEQFRAITPLYIRGTKAAIICASQCDIESFQNIDQWLELLVLQDKTTPAILAITKSDVEPFPQLEERVELIKSKFSSMFIVSAKTGENVNNLFRSAAILAIKNSTVEHNPQQDIIIPNTEKKSGCC